MSSITRSLFKQFVLCLLFCCGVAQAQEATSYRDSLRSFLNSYSTQLEVIFPSELARFGVSEQDIAHSYLPAIREFLTEVQNQSERLMELHQLIMVQGKRDAQLSAEMNTIESNLVFVTEVGIRNLLKILNETETSSGKTSRTSMARLQHFRTLAAELSEQKEIDSKSKENLFSLLDIRQSLPSQMLKLACSYLGRVCIRRESISDWLNHVGRRGYSQRQGPGFAASGFEKMLDLPKNAIVIVVSNHQDGALDVALPGLLGQTMGLDGGLKLLAHSSNYPAVQWMNKGENLLFTDRGDWQKEALSSLESAENSNRRTGLIVYPEGLVSGPLSQFPLSTKVGALSAARKWAVHFQERRPVYLAVLRTDAHEFNTLKNFRPLNVSLESLEQVPHDKIAMPDPWIVDKRHQIEALYNQWRTKMANLELRQKTPGMSGLYSTTTVETCQAAFVGILP